MRAAFEKWANHITSFDADESGKVVKLRK